MCGNSHLGCFLGSGSSCTMQVENAEAQEERAEYGWGWWKGPQRLGNSRQCRGGGTHWSLFANKTFPQPLTLCGRHSPSHRLTFTNNRKPRSGASPAPYPAAAKWVNLPEVGTKSDVQPAPRALCSLQIHTRGVQAAERQPGEPSSNSQAGDGETHSVGRECQEPP